jgi:hypothetical protein
MGWERRGGRRYYYRKARRGNVVRSVYISDFAAGLADLVDSQRRAQSAEVRRFIAADRKEGDRIAAACSSLRGATRAWLLAAGFHEHKRQWRRRRMSKANGGAAGTLSRDVIEELALLEQATFSHTPSEAAQALVAQELSRPGGWRPGGDIMGDALAGAVRACAGNYLTAESVKRGLEEMRAELGYEGSSLPERLLIEQVLLCWLRLSLLERQQTRALESNQPYAYLYYLQTATTQAQRRYTNAINSLARVRRLLRPRGPLFQVNVLAVAGDTPARASSITVEAEEVRQLQG